MSGGKVWLNGRLLDGAQATLSVADRGFLLGDGLFETMRAYGGRVFRLEAHLARLERGAARIGLALPGDLDKAVLATVQANDLGEAAIRLTVSRGPSGPGLEPPGGSEVPPTVVVTVRPYRADSALYEHGVRAVTAAARLDERRLTAGLKHTGYLEAILAVRAARAAGADEAVFLDSEGHVAEASASNLFAVTGGQLWTPPLRCGILPGITRATVIDLASGLGLQVQEEPLPPPGLAAADEAFLTSSLREIVPLVALDGVPIGPARRPGPSTRRVLQAYRDLARSAAEGVA